MPRNTSVSLGEHFSRFIDEQVESGRYATASDVIREGLRLVEERELRMEALRQALIAGEQSGPSEPFDLDQFLSSQRAVGRA